MIPELLNLAITQSCRSCNLQFPV